VSELTNNPWLHQFMYNDMIMK